MGARNAILLVTVWCGIAGAGEPKPKEADIKDIKGWIVIEDSNGGTFAVSVAPNSERRAFYGQTNKAFNELKIRSRGTNGAGWSLAWDVLRLSGITPAGVELREGTTYLLHCPTGKPDGVGDQEDVTLKEVPADRAKQIIAKAKFYVTGYVHLAKLLARDDAGIYYYVDELSPSYGGGGVRVFIGKKGAMKEVPLLDVASDTAGAVYSTKSGDVRLVFDERDANKHDASFVKGDKKAPLRVLDLAMNASLIYRDLGVYNFLGQPCESL